MNRPAGSIRVLSVSQKIQDGDCEEYMRVKEDDHFNYGISKVIKHAVRAYSFMYGLKVVKFEGYFSS